MSMQSWQELLWAATGDGTAVANSTTETVIYPDITIPANYMQNGRRLHIKMFGKLSTTGTPTITFTVRWGGVSGTILAVTEPITCGSGVSNVNWDLDITIQTRANGASGTLLATGVARVHTAAGTVVTNVFSASGYDAPAAVTSLDLSIDKALSITATWSAASASNTLTGMDYAGTSMN